MGKIAPNLLQRDFYAEKPNRNTQQMLQNLGLPGQKLYLSAFWIYTQQLSDQLYHFRASCSGYGNGALDKAFENLPNGNRSMTSIPIKDGSTKTKYRQMLKQKGIRQSMSRKGNRLTMLSWKISFDCLGYCLNFYLQTVSIYGTTFQAGTVEYLDYYNNHRISKVKGLATCTLDNNKPFWLL